MYVLYVCMYECIYHVCIEQGLCMYVCMNDLRCLHRTRTMYVCMYVCMYHDVCMYA